MSPQSAITELLKMSPEDLHREVRAKRLVIRKLKLQIGMNTEKDTARYRRERRELNRLLTILSEKSASALPKEAKASTVTSPVSRKGKRKSS